MTIPGQFLATINKLDDTLIIFTSDNGGLSTAEGSPTCNAPLAEGKGWMQDGGVRVPFIVCMPGTVPAAESDLIFSTPDIYPTLLKAAGLSLRPDQHVDGMDLWSHWLGDERTPRGPVFWHYPHYSNQGGTPGAAVRHGIFKLVRWFEDGREALYDLSSDVSEAIDIAATYPSVAKELARLLDEWSDDVCALVPQPNAHQYFLRD